MDLEICDPVVKAYFLENPPKGVEVEDRGDRVVLRSKGFKGVRFDEDGKLYILVDDQLAEELKRNPFVAVIQSIDGRDSRILISNYKAVNVKCPFCQRVGRYYVGTYPYVHPDTCKCGAVVLWNVCDPVEINEEVSDLEKFVAVPVRVAWLDGGRYLWLIFAKPKEKNLLVPSRAR